MAALGDQYNAERARRQDLEREQGRLATLCDQVNEALARAKAPAAESMVGRIDKLGDEVMRLQNNWDAARAECHEIRNQLAQDQRTLEGAGKALRDNLAALDRAGHGGAGKQSDQIDALAAERDKARADIRRMAQWVPPVKVIRGGPGADYCERSEFPDGSVCTERDHADAHALSVTWEVTGGPTSLAHEHAQARRESVERWNREWDRSWGGGSAEPRLQIFTDKPA